MPYRISGLRFGELHTGIFMEGVEEANRIRRGQEIRIERAEATIARKEAIIAEKEAVIVEMDEVIAKKDGVIIEKNAAIAEIL